MKKIIALFFYAALFITFISCSTKINLTLNKNGSVTAEFSGAIGKSFVKLLKDSSGNKTINDSDVVFDTKQIKNSLELSGFSDVTVSSKNGQDLYVKFTDTQRNSEYFTSGLFLVENGKIKINLTDKNLKKFYETTDEETVMYIDMLLSPVFNDDKMSESEYLEMLSSFYGADVAKEIDECIVEIKIDNGDKKVTNHTIKLTKLLTLNESFLLQ